MISAIMKKENKFYFSIFHSQFISIYAKFCQMVFYFFQYIEELLISTFEHCGPYSKICVKSDQAIAASSNDPTICENTPSSKKKFVIKVSESLGGLGSNAIKSTASRDKVYAYKVKFFLSNLKISKIFTSSFSINEN